MYLQSTLALRTTRYYGHPANAEKSTPPPPPPSGETHKEMTETNSRYYGLSIYITEIGGHLPPPKRDISLVFFLSL